MSSLAREEQPRSDRPERPERPDRPERSERPERPERPEYRLARNSNQDYARSPLQTPIGVRPPAVQASHGPSQAAAADAWRSAFGRLQQQVHFNTKALDEQRTRTAEQQEMIRNMHKDLKTIWRNVQYCIDELKKEVPAKQQVLKSNGEDIDLVMSRVNSLATKLVDLDNIKMSVEVFKQRLKRVEGHASPAQQQPRPAPMPENGPASYIPGQRPPPVVSSSGPSKHSPRVPESSSAALNKMRSMAHPVSATDRERMNPRPTSSSQIRGPPTGREEVEGRERDRERNRDAYRERSPVREVSGSFRPLASGTSWRSAEQLQQHQQQQQQQHQQQQQQHQQQQQQLLQREQQQQQQQQHQQHHHSQQQQQIPSAHPENARYAAWASTDPNRQNKRPVPGEQIQAPPSPKRQKVGWPSREGQDEREKLIRPPGVEAAGARIDNGGVRNDNGGVRNDNGGEHLADLEDGYSRLGRLSSNRGGGEVEMVDDEDDWHDAPHGAFSVGRVRSYSGHYSDNGTRETLSPLLPDGSRRTRARPIRNAEGILIRKDGRPDMRSISSAHNLRKVHAKKEAERYDVRASTNEPSDSPIYTSESLHTGTSNEKDEDANRSADSVVSALTPLTPIEHGVSDPAAEEEDEKVKIDDDEEEEEEAEEAEEEGEEGEEEEEEEEEEKGREDEGEVDEKQTQDNVKPVAPVVVVRQPSETPRSSRYYLTSPRQVPDTRSGRARRSYTHPDLQDEDDYHHHNGRLTGPKKEDLAMDEMSGSTIEPPAVAAM